MGGTKAATLQSGALLKTVLAQTPVKVGQGFCLRVDLRKSKCVAEGATKNAG